jgi:hypothetical protein
MTLKELVDANLKFGVALLKIMTEIAWAAASDAVTAVFVWLIWNYLMGAGAGFLQVFGFVWSFNILSRTWTHHLLPKKNTTLLRYGIANGHHYLYDANPAAFTHDLKVEQAKRTACSGRQTSQS